MRKLNTADLFCAARAVKSSGLRAELQRMIDSIAKGGVPDVQSIGIDTILQVIDVFAEHKSEQAVYEVLSGPFEMKPEEVAAMELEPLMDNLEEIFRDGGLQLFFKRLSGILGRN